MYPTHRSRPHVRRLGASASFHADLERFCSSAISGKYSTTDQSQLTCLSITYFARYLRIQGLATLAIGAERGCATGSEVRISRPFSPMALRSSEYFARPLRNQVIDERPNF